MSSYFKPLNQKEHARGNRGDDVSDYCANCGQPFMAHNNGECPATEEARERPARI